MVILRSGLAFGIGLDQEAAEIGYGTIDFLGLGPPPGPDFGIQRIGTFQVADLDRRAPAHRQIDLDAIGAQRIGQRPGLFDIFRRQAVGAGVHIVGHHAIDADAGIGAGIINQARINVPGQHSPVEDRASGIAAFDRAIEIVPMVQDAKLGPGRRHGIGDRQALLHGAQIGEHAMQHADIAVAGDHDRRMAAGRGDMADDIAFRARILQRQLQPRDHGRGGGRADQQHAIAFGARFHRQAFAHHAAIAAVQFVHRGAQSRRGAGRLQQRDMILASRLGRDGRIAQPQVIAAFGMGEGRGKQRRDGDDKG